MDGSLVKVLDVDGQPTLCRLLTFVEGTFLGDATLNTELVGSLGRYAAKMDKALLDFDHVALRARNWEWDLDSVLLNKKHLTAITSPKKRHLVSYFFQQYEQHVLPKLPDFRKTTLHNDLNEWNILVQENQVSGLIDFGDCTHSALINEVAIMATYIFYMSESPLQWAVLSRGIALDRRRSPRTLRPHRHATLYQRLQFCECKDFRP